MNKLKKIAAYIAITIFGLFVLLVGLIDKPALFGAAIFALGAYLFFANKGKKSGWIMVAGVITTMVISMSMVTPDSASEAETDDGKTESVETAAETEELSPEEVAAQEAAEKKAEEERITAEKAEQEAKAKAEAEALAAAEAAAKAKEEALKMSGSGDTATQQFELESGFVVFDMSHNDGGNFIVELLDSNGNKIELLTNEIGSYKGKALALIPNAGSYLLNVQADGSWTANGSQTIPSETITSGIVEGSGSDVKFVDIEAGLKTFTMSHSGQGNFIVMANGEVVIANEIGNYSGSSAQQVQDTATYIISVQADGDWKIEIQ